MFYLALTWEIQEELEAWWTHYSQPIADRSSHLPSIGAPRRKELYDWSGSSPLILSILFKKEYENKSEDEVVQMFTDTNETPTSAFHIIRKDVQAHIHKKIKNMDDVTTKQ